ncbi:hypothetical protein K440DRAFT_638976 [Wilcoxina mikolae CBS 423.85]|nr:hypothetical protein K440DRAFT_638976 [Wilcoxina mikolae CBS 423.85]
MVASSTRHHQTRNDLVLLGQHTTPVLNPKNMPLAIQVAIVRGALVFHHPNNPPERTNLHRPSIIRVRTSPFHSGHKALTPFIAVSLKKAPISASAPSTHSNLKFVFPPPTNRGGSPPATSKPTIRIVGKGDENSGGKTHGNSAIATEGADPNHPGDRHIEHLKTVAPEVPEVPDTGVCTSSTGRSPVAKSALSTCTGKTAKAKPVLPTAALYSENVLPAEIPSPSTTNSPPANETLHYHLTKVDRRKQQGPARRITHQRTDSMVSLASISSVSSIHGSNLPQWEQFDVLPREQESYTSFPKYQSNSMRSSSLMRIGATIIGEDSKSGLTGIRGFLSRVWSRKDRSNDLMYRPSTLKRSSSAEEDEDHSDTDGQTIDSKTTISAAHNSHDKGKSKAGTMSNPSIKPERSNNHPESASAKSSFDAPFQKPVSQEERNAVIKDGEAVEVINYVVAPSV